MSRPILPLSLKRQQYADPDCSTRKRPYGTNQPLLRRIYLLTNQASLATSCVNTTAENAGCAVLGPPKTFGPAFNQHGDGTFALSLTNVDMRQWFFNRFSTPDFIPLSSPTWGTPGADFWARIAI